jgi:hypothetical protein
MRPQLGGYWAKEKRFAISKNLLEQTAFKSGAKVVTDSRINKVS